MHEIRGNFNDTDFLLPRKSHAVSSLSLPCWFALSIIMTLFSLPVPLVSLYPVMTGVTFFISLLTRLSLTVSAACLFTLLILTLLFSHDCAKGRGASLTGQHWNTSSRMACLSFPLLSSPLPSTWHSLNSLIRKSYRLCLYTLCNCSPFNVPLSLPSSLPG